MTYVKNYTIEVRKGQPEKIEEWQGSAECASGSLPLLSSGLSTVHNSTVSNISMWVNGSLIRVQRNKLPGVGAGKGGRRGKVKGFSRASRRRLLKKIAKTDKERRPIFVTLTFPDEIHNIAADERKKVELAKKCLKRFEMRFRRKWGEGANIWRMEGENRKSGLYIGEWFPHFHLLVWGIDKEDMMKWVSYAWWESCDKLSEDHLKAGTRVEVIRSWKGVMSYVSKYMTKVEENEFEEGRVWGVVSIENLPMSKIVVQELDEEQAVKLIRAMRRFAHLRGRDYKSLTIFCDAEFWLSCLDKFLTL